MECVSGSHREAGDTTEPPHYFVRPFKEGPGGAWWVRQIVNEVRWVCQQREGRVTLTLVAVNLGATLLLLSWCHATRSMALMAYTYLSWFSLLSLVTRLVCVWSEGQQASPSYSCGYLRCEVAAVFASVTLSLLGAVVIVKECVERLIEPEVVHTGLLSVGGVGGLVLHLGMTSVARNRPLAQILRVSHSSLLQEHVADMCHSLCGYIPALTRLLLPRVDPVVLISIAGFLAILVDHLILQIYNYQWADSIAALVIAVLTITTMFPLCVSSASILLQTTPGTILAPLDKCLREALTLDGVLEFRHERFWALGVGGSKVGMAGGMSGVSGDMSAARGIPGVGRGLTGSSGGIVGAMGDPGGFVVTGSLHVRIRRDANEQLVLAHVRERLAPLVPLLTVQVYKDDWTRSPTTLQLLNDSARALVTSPSHSPHYVNVTYPTIYPRSPAPFPPHTRHSYFANPKYPIAASLQKSNAPYSSISFVPPGIPPATSVRGFADGTTRSYSTSQSRHCHSHSHSHHIGEEAVCEAPESDDGDELVGWTSEASEHEVCSYKTPSSISHDPKRVKENHSPKPSPYYVNVDFSAKPSITQTTTGTLPPDRSDVSLNPR